MLKVRFRVNLGSMDAKELGLDCRKCQTGDECNVTDEAGEWLLKRGIVELANEVKGVAKQPSITAPGKQ